MADDDHRTTVTIPADLYKEVKRRLDDAKARQEVPRNLHPNQYLILLVERGLKAEPPPAKPKGRVK